MTSAFQSDAFQNDAFQIDITVSVPAVEEPQGIGNWNLLKKNRPKRMRYSDLEARKALAIARRAYSTAELKTTFIEPESPTDNDDDHILIAAVSKLIH